MLKVLGNPVHLRYEVTVGSSYAVRYSPRNRFDSTPWIQVGGLELRLRSTEIIAAEGPGFFVQNDGLNGFTVRHIVSRQVMTPKPFTSRYAAQIEADRLSRPVR